MPRPKLCRKINSNPEIVFYKPKGVPLKDLKTMEINLEEWESLRLKNVLEYDQTKSAGIMGTSQSTFQRIYTNAQKKLSRAIIEGMAIKINKNL